MDDGSSEGAAQQASELEKTSLKDAIAVFDRTFMRDLWVTIKYALSSLRTLQFPGADDCVDKCSCVLFHQGYSQL
jgi:hypothetical protein